MATKKPNIEGDYPWLDSNENEKIRRIKNKKLTTEMNTNFRNKEKTAKLEKMRATPTPRTAPGSGSSGSTSETRYNRLTGGGLRDLDK